MRKCDWTKCNMVKMQQVFHHNKWWTYVNKTASGIKKKSILFVLPDILMFNMRVLYYHDDNEYSCAILVYCCLNVTLFFYDTITWKLWAWEWWPTLKKSENRWWYLYTEWMWMVASSLSSGQILHHFSWGSTRCRCTILNTVLLYDLNETFSNNKMYIDILPTHCSYMLCWRTTNLQYMALEIRYQNKGYRKKKKVDCKGCILSEKWNRLFGDITADQRMYIGLGFQHTDFCNFRHYLYPCKAHGIKYDL